MKILKIMMIIAGCFLISISGASSVLASQYLGEYCWQTDVGDIIELGITNMGDGHYLLNGKVIETEGIINPVHGNAEIVGNKVYMTTTSAGTDGYDTTWTHIGFGILDLPSLNGTIEIMGVSHDKVPPPNDPYLDYDGPMTLTFITCP